MKQVFREHQPYAQHGPLGAYIESYEAEMRARAMLSRRERCKFV